MFAGCLFVALGALAINGTLIGVLVDDAIYLQSGRRLVLQGEYRVPFLPGEPFAGKYPPLYPLVIGLLSVPLETPPAGLWSIKLVSLLLWMPGFVCLGALLMGPRMGPGRMGAAILWLTALSGPLLSLGIEVMSEGLFFGLCMAALLCLTRSRDTHDERSVGSRQFAAAVFAVLAWYTRGLGLAMCVAVAIEISLRDRRRGALAVMGMGAACLPWLYLRQRGLAGEPMLAVTPYLLSYDYHLEGLRTFLSEGGSLLAYLATSAQAAAHGLGGALLPIPLHPVMAAGEAGVAGSPFGMVKSALAWSIAAMVAVGSVRSLCRRDGVALFALGYAAMVTLWPWFNKVRFFAVLLPLWCLFAVRGAHWLLRCALGATARGKRGAANTADGATGRLPVAIGLSTIALVAITMAGQLGHYTQHVFLAGDVAAGIASDGSPRQPSEVERAGAWLRSHTPPSAVLVVNFGGPLLALHARRQVLPYLMARRGADHIAGALGAAPRATNLDLEGVLERAQTVLGGRPLWHVQLCQAHCEPLSAHPTAITFGADNNGAPSIRVTPLR